MTPFPTPAQLAAAMQKCREARAAADQAEGLERLQLLNAAFPYAIQGGDSHCLRVSWHPAERGWTIADGAGFITVLPADDLPTLCVMLGMEAARQGSVRELITGEKRRSALPPIPEHKPKRREPKPKPTLADLQLNYGEKDGKG